jgi:hypothetical protein
MKEAHEATEKFHYICQTYIAAKGKQAPLQVEKLFEYSSASQAEERAAREFNSETCVGADAYSLAEDLNSGEVGLPVFLARHGRVPENEDF